MYYYIIILIANFRTFLAKFGTAEAAAVRSDTVVLPRVDLQRTFLRECLGAKSALHKNNKNIHVKRSFHVVVYASKCNKQFVLYMQIKSIYLKWFLSSMHPDMSHQLARLLKILQTYGTFIHCFMFRSSLSLLYYLRLQLWRNKRDKTPGEQSYLLEAFYRSSLFKGKKR